MLSKEGIIERLKYSEDVEKIIDVLRDQQNDFIVDEDSQWKEVQNESKNVFDMKAFKQNTEYHFEDYYRYSSNSKANRPRPIILPQILIDQS